MSLRVRFWGTRGSVPSPGRHTARYGGNTPCVEVRTPSGRLIVLDAGTGLRPLGRSLVERRTNGGIDGDIFLTHMHWDHIQGIPFFAPFFTAGNTFRVWAWQGLEAKLERVIRDLMSPAVFPVAFADLPSAVEFRDVEADDRYELDCSITTLPVQHPGGALGYKLAPAGDDRRAMVYISDNELEGHGASRAGRDELVKRSRGASVLIHDTTYLASEYEAHRGWGHSTNEQAVDLALESEVERLVLFHHKPDRTDDEVDRMVEGCAELVDRRGGKLSVCAAAEGMELNV